MFLLGARHAMPLLVFIFASLAFAQEAPPPLENKETQAVPSVDAPQAAFENKTSPSSGNQTAKTTVVDEKFGVAETPVTPSSNQGTSKTSFSEEEATGTDDELIYLNATDVDVKDMIKQISKATGSNFLIDDKVRGKVTIISEKPMTKEMAYQAFLSALEVMGYTTVKSPGGLIKIVQTKEAVSKPIDLYKEDSPNTDGFITRIIQVKNISANDLSTVVKSLVSKDGNLFAYPQTNSLILTDAGSNIDRILKIIRELDQEGPQEVIEIIPIVNADAKDITEKVLQLYEGAGAQTSGRGGTAARRANRGAPELEDTPSISKVISDDRTNSIIVLGSKRSIVKLRALIERLDTAITGVEGTIHVYYLKHATASELSEVLSSLVGGAKIKSSKEKGAGGAAEARQGAVELEGGVKVTADEGTNSLVITASPKDYETLIERVISKLDIPRRQVYLEAVIMELRIDKTKNIGLNGNFGLNFNVSGRDMTGFGSLLPTFPTALNSIATAAGGLAGGGFSADSIDFTLSDGTSLSIPAVSTILQALQTDSNANVLSTPSILTLDNEEAKIQVGQEVPTPGQSSISSGVATTSVTREDTGIILKVTPQISESSTVRLKIEQEITNVRSSDPVLGPTFDKSSVTTVVVANDKQTIVIGGLLEDRDTASIGKVPLLGDVPILGNLFKTTRRDRKKADLLVFITPYIIKDRADYLEILQKKIEERNMFIEHNYGSYQRKQIRQAIKEHAKDLLEYSTAVRTIYDENPNSSSTSKTPYVTPTTSNTSTGYETSTSTSSEKKNESTEEGYVHPTRRVRGH